MEKGRSRNMVFITLCLFMFGTRCVVKKQGLSDNNRVKVDSIMSYYFELFTMEVNKTPFDLSNQEYFNQIYLDTDTVYMLKDLPKASMEVERLSGIKSFYSDNSKDMLLTQDILDEWKSWYVQNKSSIFWDEKKQRLRINK